MLKDRCQEFVDGKQSFIDNKLYRWRKFFMQLGITRLNIKSILVPTLEEQKANHTKGFVPYHDDPDAIVDNWATTLESGTSIFWDDLLHANLEGRRNFFHGYGERVQRRDREKPEDIIHEQSTPQQGTTTAEQTRSPSFNPTVNKSIPPQASSHADNSMVLREIQTLKQTVENMCTKHESQFSQLEKLITENSNRVDILTNIISRFVQQQLETWKGGNRDENSGGGGEHSRGVDVRINGGGDFEVEDVTNAPPDVCFKIEINIERDIEDSYLNEFFYQTLTCSSDEDCEEDVLDVEQPKRQPQRHLKKSKYKKTPYTDPGPKKMMFRKGSIKEFDPLRLPDNMRKPFEDYKSSDSKPPFTSGLGLIRGCNFFDKIITEQFWLLSDHIEEAVYGIRKRQSKYRDVINQDVVILDEIFGQLLVMNANEDGIIDDCFMTYVRGDIPKMRRYWNGATALYFMLNLYDTLDTNVTKKERGKHWVSVKIDLITAELVIFYYNWKCYEKVKIDRFMDPV
ncbi:hypothetical protein TIFTF001_015324 [Ficus carica]|uniref:Uncharacterized protein n=1 Tax=Ficus carica TaxID=3494 RepID=A0AA88ASA1_FICCA|nr:hypothetical protein TIFTF001_015324 [Ficus carica]